MKIEWDIDDIRRLIVQGIREETNETEAHLQAIDAGIKRCFDQAFNLTPAGTLAVSIRDRPMLRIVTPVTDTPVSPEDNAPHTEGVTTLAPISDADTPGRSLLLGERHEDCDCPSCLSPYF